MRSFIALSALLAYTTALTISSPSADAILDPTQPLTITWTTTSSDPDTITILLDSTSPISLTKNTKLATTVAVSRGTYIVPANTIQTYGSDFVIRAEDASGAVLATSAPFSLAIDGAAVVTSSGQLSFQSTYTAGAISTNSIGATGVLGTTAGAIGTSTGTAVSSFSTVLSPGLTGLSSLNGTMAAATTTIVTSRSGSMTTSVVAVSTGSTSTRASSASAANPTTSANAQPRLAVGGAGSMVLSAAGVLAGVAALLA